MKGYKKFKSIIILLIVLSLIASFCTSRYLLKTVFLLTHIEYRSLYANDSSWEIEGITWENNAVRCTVPSAQIPYLSDYIKSFFQSSKLCTLTLKQAGVVVKNNPVETSPPEKKSDIIPFNVLQKIFRIGGYVACLLPEIIIKDASCIARNIEINITEGYWNYKKLEALVSIPKIKQTFKCSAEIDSLTKGHLKIEATHLDVHSICQIRFEPTGFYIQGVLSAFKNPIHYSALLSPGEKLPKKAWIQAEKFQMPELWLKEIMAVETMPCFNFKFLWENKRYDFALDAVPALSNDQTVTSVDARIYGIGDLDTLKLSTFYLRAPWLLIVLEDPIAIYLKHIAESSFSFKLKTVVDFSKQSFLPLKGILNGMTTVESLSKRWLPAVQLALNSSNLKIFDLDVTQSPLYASVNWPKIQMDSLLLQFEDESFIKAVASIDLDQKNIHNAEVEANLKNKLLSYLLPSNLKLEAIELSSKAQGNWMETISQIHSSHNVICKQLRMPFLKTCDLNVSMSGSGNSFPNLYADVQFAEGGCHLEGYSNISLNKSTLDFTKGFLTYNQTQNLFLTRPFCLTLEPLWKDQSKGLACGLNTIHFENNEIKFIIDADYKPQTIMTTNMWLERLENAFLCTFLNKPPYIADIDIYDINFNYQKSPDVHTLNSRGLFSVSFHDWGNFITDYSIRLDNDGTLLSISSRQNNEPFLKLQGRIPLVMDLTKDSVYHFVRDFDLNTNGKLIGNPAFCGIVNKLTGINLVEPTLQSKLYKTYTGYEGFFNLTAKHFSYDRSSSFLQKLTSLDQLEMNVQVTESGIVLSKCEGLMAQNPVKIKGEWPVAFDQLMIDLLQHKLPDWSQATGSMLIKEIPLNTFKEILPYPLKPTGTFALKALLKENKSLQGILSFNECYTFPINPIGSLQKVSLDVGFNKEAIKIQKFNGLLNQKPITLEGKVTHNMGPLKDFKYDLHLKSGEVLVARFPGTRIKGVLDLSLATQDSGSTEFTGTIDLTEGFTQLAAIDLQGSTSFPEEAPPYFSIDMSPFNAWGLDLRIKGDKFMKIRTSAFDATASAFFTLTGNLQAPIPKGQITFNSALLKFPFANFHSDKSTITLLDAVPYTPLLSMEGTTRLYGYNLKIQAKGPISQPIIEFRSSPSLEASQIVNMVTTGSSPDMDYSQSSLGRLGNLGLFIGKGLLGGLGQDTAINEKIEVSMAEDVTETGDETINLGYKLNDKMTLRGEYDRFGAFNFDIKWKLYSK